MDDEACNSDIANNHVRIIVFQVQYNTRSYLYYHDITFFPVTMHGHLPMYYSYDCGIYFR